MGARVLGNPTDRSPPFPFPNPLTHLQVLRMQLLRCTPPSCCIRAPTPETPAAACCFCAACTICGYCTIMATVSSLWLVFSHIACYTNPSIQQRIIRILLIVPVYACQSWFALWIKEWALYLDLLRCLPLHLAAEVPDPDPQTGPHAPHCPQHCLALAPLLCPRPAPCPHKPRCPHAPRSLPSHAAWASHTALPAHTPL